jgi:zinc transporter, ZIP family
MSVRPGTQAPGWALGLVAAVLFLGTVLAVLPEGADSPDEQLVLESTALSPGTIELTVRNTDSDPVRIAQVFVNDAYVDVAGASEAIDRLATDTLRLNYPWQDGQPYLVSLLMADGSVVEHEITASDDPAPAGPGYLGSMALLGACVGIVALLLGMPLLPALRRAWPAAIRMLLAVVVGLLAFLIFELVAKGVELAERTGAVFGGAALVVLGAAVAYLLLTGVGHMLTPRPAVGIGLHNLCAGLAIGSAYAADEPALGTAIVIGFALINITEGDQLPPLLALAAGAPAIVGAVLGAAVDDAELSAFLLGIGVGTIIHVISRLAPRLRERTGGLAPSTLYSVLAGVLIMFVTGLIVA